MPPFPVPVKSGAGPIQTGNHYHIDPLHRLDWEEVQHLIATGKYFVLHAPRQTGKTSTLLAMSEALNEGGVYKSLYVNIEAAQNIILAIRRKGLWFAASHMVYTHLSQSTEIYSWQKYKQACDWMKSH